MKLYFLGRGGAFFTEEGNTAAFFIEDRKLFLIDCGELVFKKIKESHVLEFAHIDEIFVFITHCHSDHYGSLPSLVMYCAFGDPNKVIKCNIVCASALEEAILNHLRESGCFGHFKLMKISELDGLFDSFCSARYIRTIHQPHFPAFSLEFLTSEGRVFYSGDTQDIELIRSYVGQCDIAALYIETISRCYPYNAHMPLDDLHNIIPAELRDKTYLMHFDSYECIERAKELGFGVVEVIR